MILDKTPVPVELWRWNGRVYDCRNCDTVLAGNHLYDGWDFPYDECNKNPIDGGLNYQTKRKKSRCKSCGTCCRKYRIPLRMCEYFKILQLAEQMNIEVPKHTPGYMPLTGKNGRTCIFLNTRKNKCRLYEIWRPLVCQRYLCQYAKYQYHAEGE